jgi:hypothetical protein
VPISPWELLWCKGSPLMRSATRVLLVTPNTHERVTQGADVHSSIQAPSVVAEERVKVESPQRSEENRP